MKEKYVKCNIKNFEHYRISNYGNVINTRRNNFVFGFLIANGKIQVHLHNKDEICRIMLHKLVLMHFKENELNLDCGIHLDYDVLNNKVDNLEWASVGDAIAHTRRKNNTINKTKRGIYKWGIGKKTYRAILAVGKGKAKTLGYFNNKKDATRVYKEEYYKMFGELPF